MADLRSSQPEHTHSMKPQYLFHDLVESVLPFLTFKHFWPDSDTTLEYYRGLSDSLESCQQRELTNKTGDRRQSDRVGHEYTRGTLQMEMRGD